MATENPWGAPRIHGELLRLGFDVSERIVSRYLRSLPRTPRANATWGTFLRNHRDGIAAMDFFTVPTAMFRVPHVFLVIRHGRRDVVRCAVTTSPTAAWVAQQLRETFPFESAPRFLIFVRDAIFSAGLTATIRSMLKEPTRTSYQSPWQNGVAERFVGTVRRELLDHVIVLNERHLRQLIESFVTYYNVDRTHVGVGKDSPCGRPVEQRPAVTSNVVSLPRVGGLHHRYAWRRPIHDQFGEALAARAFRGFPGVTFHPRVWSRMEGLRRQLGSVSWPKSTARRSHSLSAAPPESSKARAMEWAQKDTIRARAWA
jgi:transposase InsO family protein